MPLLFPARRDGRLRLILTHIYDAAAVAVQEVGVGHKCKYVYILRLVHDRFVSAFRSRFMRWG